MGGVGGAAVAAGQSHIPRSDLPRLRKSDRRIFHTKASLQKLSAKVGSAGSRWGPQAQGCRGHRLVAPSPLPSLALHVPSVLGTAGRALQAARGGAERVRLRSGVCRRSPGALPAGRAARCHAGRSCPDPPQPLPGVPVLLGGGAAGRVPLVGGQG